MSLDGVVASLPYHHWCVNVALLSFRGEAWALTCGKGGNCSEGSAESVDKKEKAEEVKNGGKEENGIELHICDDEFKNHANKIEKLNSMPEFYDVVQKCNDNTTLIKNIKNVEFVMETPTLPSINAVIEDDEMSVNNKTPVRYKLHEPLDPLMKDVLTPAVSAVVEECLNAIVLVYGATQEMKQLGVVGTPEECGLLPYGICMVMNRCAERRERHYSSTSWSLAPPTAPEISTGTKSTDGNNNSSNNNNSSSGSSSCGSHRFVRAEASFIAFDALNIVDLIDLNNQSVELALRPGGDSTQSTRDDHQDVDSKEEPPQDEKKKTTTTSVISDAYVCHARTLPAEHASHALEALDIGLDNFTRAAEIGLLQSQAGTSLLYSLTLFTDDCHSATFHLMCFAEDAVLQNWLVSSALTFSQTVPDVDELNSTNMQNVSLPPPPPKPPQPPTLHHKAAALLVPLLSCGNIFASVLICAYNSITAIRRLTRDLSFALAGSHMITAPYVTPLISRRSQQPLPEGWEESFTYDGRRYYIEKSTKQATWENPRIDKKEELVNGVTLNNEKNGIQQSNILNSVRDQEPARVQMSSEDELYLEEGLRRACRGTSRLGETSHVDPPYTIVVIDVQEEKHVLLGPAASKKKSAEITAPVPVTTPEMLLYQPPLVPISIAAVNRKTKQKFRSDSPISPDDEDDDDEYEDNDNNNGCDDLKEDGDGLKNGNVNEVDYFSSQPAVYDVADLTGFNEGDDDDEEEEDFDLEEGKAIPCNTENTTTDTVRFYANVMNGENKMGSSITSVCGGNVSSTSTTSGDSSDSDSSNNNNSNSNGSNSGGDDDQGKQTTNTNNNTTTTTNTATNTTTCVNNTNTNNSNNNTNNSTTATTATAAVVAAATPQVSVSLELQELESLTDEFTRFYRESCETKRKLQQVELELGREREENAKLREQLAALKGTIQE
ncbi:uncharacterized protein TM35_000073870 [Trypanosoma theileri]|uniref:WW domain-containing protein n=1 Tax=Trypanosoma theileri TaxID=67003 RepID=A0A1X0P2P7_9TRYP|nr:uncharacterized protein TM35_000073870 [Trypanosoma theileri]ORC90963.1 hypothetical protein TM35_000073870 [Trypanosoma theileri]